MSLLDLLTLGHIGKVVDRTVQPQAHGHENMFASPGRRDGLGGKLVCSLCSHLLLEASNCGEVGTEVGEYLAETGLGKLGDVDRAEAATKIIETMTPLADLRRNEAERIAVVSDPPTHARPERHSRLKARQLASGANDGRELLG